MDRYLEKIRIAKIRCAICIHSSFDLRDKMKIGNRVVSPIADRIRFNRLEHLNQRNATTRRRAYGYNLVVFVLVNDRLSPHGAIILQVIVRHQSMATLHFGNDIIGGFPFIESGGAKIADAFQRFAEIDKPDSVLRHPFFANQKIRNDRIV